MGPLPKAGGWVRLEVPAAAVGLAGRTVTGMAFSLYDGKATWDRAGKFASTITKHYSFNGMTIAMQDGGTLRYLHSDHLSSNTLVTNADGTLHSSQNYCAYGQKRFATWYGSECDPTAVNTLPTDRTFTGQEQDGTGLHYYRARFYDSALGTFISPDTLVPQPGVVLDCQRYLYTRGNPLKFSDPTGHMPCGKTCEGDSTDWRMASEDSLAKGSQKKSTDLSDILANTLSQIDITDTPFSVSFDDTGEPHVDFDSNALRKAVLSPLTYCASVAEGVCGVSVGGTTNTTFGAGGRVSVDVFVDSNADLVLLLTAGGGAYTPFPGTTSRLTVTGIPHASLDDVDGTFGQLGLSGAVGPWGGYGEAVFGKSDSGHSIRGQTYGYAYAATGVSGDFHLTITQSWMLHDSRSK